MHSWQTDLNTYPPEFRSEALALAEKVGVPTAAKEPGRWSNRELQSLQAGGSCGISTLAVKALVLSARELVIFRRGKAGE